MPPVKPRWPPSAATEHDPLHAAKPRPTPAGQLIDLGLGAPQSATPMTSRPVRNYTPGEYLRRGLWALVQPLWRFSPRPVWAWRNLLLRLFGARIARGVRIYPSACIHQPWNLAIGPRTTVGWNATLYALGPLCIGADSVISQGAHLCAGNHDHRDPGFVLIKAPLTVGDGVWIAAEAFIGPGVVVGDRAVVGARAVVMRPVPAAAVVAGNPAQVVGRR